MKVSKFYTDKKNILNLSVLKKELSDLKIIDAEIDGHNIIFYLGKKDIKDYWGDDWDDAPYEHNAGPVYDRFVEKILVAHYPYCNHFICEPSTDVFNSEYCKDDFKKREAPCCAVGTTDDEYYWLSRMVDLLLLEESVPFYYEDEATKIIDKNTKILPIFVEIIEKSDSQ